MRSFSSHTPKRSEGAGTAPKFHQTASKQWHSSLNNWWWLPTALDSPFLSGILRVTERIKGKKKKRKKKIVCYLTCLYNKIISFFYFPNPATFRPSRDWKHHHKDVKNNIFSDTQIPPQPHFCSWSSPPKPEFLISSSFIPQFSHPKQKEIENETNSSPAEHI